MVGQFAFARRFRRIGKAGLAVALGIGLTACQARGGGQLPAGPQITDTGVAQFQANASFGFNLTCDIINGKPVVRGQLAYHDQGASTIPLVGGFASVDLHGELDPMVVDAPTCEALQNDVGAFFPGSALFQGRYRPQSLDPTFLGAQDGTFTVQVFDQGEPGHTTLDFTGDGFSIELFGGRYNGYTRGGDIQSGNVQVDQ
jgi:hypothetical protein